MDTDRDRCFESCLLLLFSNWYFSARGSDRTRSSRKSPLPIIKGKLSLVNPYQKKSTEHPDNSIHSVLHCDLIAGLNPDAVEFGVSEETHVHADRHPRHEHIIAVRAEEGAFRLVQADRMHERADQILFKSVFVEIGAGGRVDLSPGQADLPVRPTLSISFVRQNASRRYFMHSICFGE